ncbi:MAG: CheR family methyltransferase [Ectothiorhodospiraceae bacterium]|jgi:chemotaxis methyl-accepting protein methylase
MALSTLATDQLVLDDRRGGERLPAMDDGQFREWAELLRERTGMHLPAERKSFLVTSVALRMRELGFLEFDDYREFLVSGRAGSLEWTSLVDRLTVQETRFFRDPSAMDFVVRDCLPRLTQQVAAGESPQLWSAGCATGEEAFSLAMILDRHLRREGQRPYYGVTGSDISLHALATARAGVYPERRLAGIPTLYRDEYCEPASGGRFRVAERLRRRSCFAQLNLLEADAAPLGGMDLIYCQNVLIYFDREHRMRILDGLAGHLRPGGTLVLGAGEIIGWSHPELERIGGPQVLAFRRKGE